MASQPVAVHIPVGPPRAEELIYLPANEPLVLAYPCLPWVQHVAAGGAQQQASLPQFVAIRVFLLRNAIGTGPNDLAIARTRTPLTISFSAGAWSRWLTELVASGILANAPYARLRDSDAVLLEMTITTPANLEVLAGDYSPFEDFASAGTPGVPGVAARPALGRGTTVRDGPNQAARAAVAAVAAIPPNPGPPELAFIQSASLVVLNLPGSHAPLQSFCRLVGALGPAGSRAIRDDLTSTVRTTALSLRVHLGKSLGLGSSLALTASNDAALAREMSTSIASAYDALTTDLALNEASEFGLSRELLDAYLFLLGSAADVEAVLTRRLIYIEDRYAPLSRSARSHACVLRVHHTPACAHAA